jgi:hypothetical protein
VIPLRSGSSATQYKKRFAWVSVEVEVEVEGGGGGGVHHLTLKAPTNAPTIPFAANEPHSDFMHQSVQKTILPTSALFLPRPFLRYPTDFQLTLPVHVEALNFDKVKVSRLP